MRQYETIDWKQYAQQQQISRSIAEENLSRSNAAFKKAQQMLQRLLGYSRKLEREANSLRSALQNANQILQERKVAIELLQQENNQLRGSFATNSAQLQKAQASLTAAQQKLDFAEQKVEFSSALELLAGNAAHQSFAAAGNFDQYFEYKPILINTAIN